MSSAGRVARAGAIAAAIVLSGCSKTEDTAAGRLQFGDPPVIEGVTVEATNRTARCDFSDVVLARFCGGGIPDAVPISPIMIQGDYTEVVFKARASDPNSTEDRSDIMLVTASFVYQGNKEKSLIMLDDGSTLVNEFPIPQADPNGALNCDTETCVCELGIFNVLSSDTTKGDGEFTRAHAFILQNSLPLVSDCVARDYKQPRESAVPGETMEFRIDAVDRNGNLATWHLKPTATTVTEHNSACTGDPCGCCFLMSADPGSECGGLEGMPSSQFPDGVCKAF